MNQDLLRTPLFSEDKTDSETDTILNSPNQTNPKQGSRGRNRNTKTLETLSTVTRIPRKKFSMTIGFPTKSSGPSFWPPVLTTDEPFVELIRVGQHLPSGRKHLFEWEKERKADTGNYVILIDEDDSDDDDCIQLNGPTKETKALKDKVKMSDEDGNSSSFSDTLTTTETFPSKWLIDSDDDSIDWSNEKDPYRYTPRSRNKEDIVSGRAKQSGSRKRKSSVFGTSGKEQQHWWKEEREIEELIPLNPSGVVDVMGRTICLNRFAGSDDSCLYSMLRAWVQDDPDNLKFEHKQAGTETRRKSLLQYAALKKSDDDGNGDGNNIKNRGDKSGTTTTAIATATSTATATATGTGTGTAVPGSELTGTTNKTGKVATEATTQPINFLKWLDTAPVHRDSIPFYPTQQEMQEDIDGREAKQAAKIARKERIASIKKKLKRKGIVL